MCQQRYIKRISLKYAKILHLINTNKINKKPYRKYKNKIVLIFLYTDVHEHNYMQICLIFNSIMRCIYVQLN